MNKSNPSSTGAVSRRNFLQSTSVATGGALLGSLSLERAVHAASDDTVKIALIGCGGRGSGAAAQALSTKGKTELVAMADAFRDRLEGGLNSIKNEVKNEEKIKVTEDNKFVGFDA